MPINLNEIYRENAEKFLLSARIDKEHLNINPRNLEYIQKPEYPNPHRISDKSQDLSIKEQIRLRKKDQIINNKSSIKKKKMHIFSISFNPQQKLLAIGTANRDLNIFVIYWDTNELHAMKCFTFSNDSVV